ncbi:hypothetical protein HY636_02040 [Candidatus Woesearchaeota archaeon]|nr:hypothetical protein [Candidatus Woesearchaeota archaeon]
MSMQQIALIREETPLGGLYLIVDSSKVQRGGTFDQIEYDRRGNLKLSKYERESGEFAHNDHILVYSTTYTTLSGLALAVKRELGNMRVSNRRNFGLEDISAHLSSAGYKVSEVVTPTKTEDKNKGNLGLDEEGSSCADMCTNCPSYNNCYGSHAQDEASARGYQGSGIRFDPTDGGRVRFDPAYLDRMGRMLEDLLSQRRNRR